MPDRVVRIPGSDTTWYVDGGNVRHHIPNGGTFLCLTAWKGKQVVELSQDQVNLLSQGDDASCRVDEAANTVIRRTDTGQSSFVDGNLIRHHIPDGGTYGCLIAEGGPLIDGVSPEQVDAIEAGDDATCVPPPQAPGVRIGWCGSPEATRPGTWMAAMSVITSPTAAPSCASPRGRASRSSSSPRTRSTCSAKAMTLRVLVDEAANTVIRRTDTGQSWFVDGNLIRHHLPTGGMFNCLVHVYGHRLIDGVSPGQVDAIESGGDATCSALLEGPNGEASYYITGTDERYWVPDGGVFVCLHDQRHVRVFSYSNWDTINLFEDRSSWASCP